MMKEKNKKVYNKLRIINLYSFAFFILFILQKYSLDAILGLQDIILSDRTQNVLFTISSLVIVKLFVKVSIPDEKDRRQLFTVKRIRHDNS